MAPSGPRESSSRPNNQTIPIDSDTRVFEDRYFLEATLDENLLTQPEPPAHDELTVLLNQGEAQSSIQNINEISMER